MLWKTDIDNKIYELLTNKEKLYFNQILKEVYPYQKERKNQETLRIHLKKMIDQGILDRDNLSVGKERFYYFSEKTKFEKKLGIFEGINSSMNVKSNLLYKKRAILILLFSLSDSMMYRKYQKKYYAKEPGYFLSNNNEYLDYHISRMPITDLDYYDVKNINRYFNSLKEIIPGIIPTISDSNGVRFTISDIYLNNFLRFSLIILKLLIEYVEKRFFVLNKREKEEYEWLKLIRGDSYANQIFLRIGNNNKKSETIKQRYIRYHKFEKIISSREIIEKILKHDGEIYGCPDYLTNSKKFDEFIKKQLIVYIKAWNEDLKIESDFKFQDVKTKYKNIYDIVVELIYPQFLRNIHKINFFE